MSKPETSVIMPVKNAQAYLSACLESIVSQTFGNWELIAIDDHSTDNSKEIITAIAKKDKRIRLLNNSGNGIIDALKMALSHVRGTYVTRMDADDLMPPNRLELMLTEIQSIAQNTVVTGLVEYVADCEISAGYKGYEQWINEINLHGKQWQHIYRECVIASPNWMINHELLQAISLSDLAYPEDYHLVLKWYQSGMHVKVIPEVTLLWREHANRISRLSEDYSQSSFFKLKINFFLQHDYRSEHLALWGTNPKGILAAEILDKAKVPFTWMDLSQDQSRKGNHKIGYYRDLESMQSPQLLIAVYPPKNERETLESYLLELGMELGNDFWYL